MCSVSVMPLQLCNMRCDMFALSRCVDAQSRVSQDHLSHASSSACICDDACSYALCAACCRSVRVRTCHARPSHIVHCSDIVGVPAKGSARNALVLCSCSCRRHALHVLRVRWCAQPGRVLPKNSGAATAKELGDFGARSDTKTKKCRGILEKGGPLSVPWSCVQG